MGRIEEIYSDYLQSEEYGEAVNLAQIDIKDSKKAAEIWACIGDTLYVKLERLIDDVMLGREEFGFINGFRYAMQLQFEYGIQLELDKIKEGAILLETDTK